MLDRRPGLRRRLVQEGVDGQRDKPLNPGPYVTRQGHPIRQAPIQAAQQDRDHVRQIEGLAPDRHALRQVRQDLPLSRGPHRNRHLLPLTINEPGVYVFGKIKPHQAMMQLETSKMQAVVSLVLNSYPAAIAR